MGNNTIKLLLYGAITLFLGYSLINNFRLLLKARSNLATAQTELVRETERNNQLNNSLSEAGKMVYLERVARDTLGLAQEGELVLIIPSEDELKKLSPRVYGKRVEEARETEPSNWKKWLQLFI